MRLVFAVALAAVASQTRGADAPRSPHGRPNIVWIVTEDISPSLGCYADPDAVTPNLDRLAAQGARFTRCFSHAPVCAPTRSGLISGQYPTTLGSHHMRSKLVSPPPTFTEHLRKAGYKTFWPGKTDFNFDPPKGWVDSTADWTRDPSLLPADGPFFAYVNFTVSHEGQIRAGPAKKKANAARLTPGQRHDPAKVHLPPYYPDVPEVRADVATYHDNVSATDHLVGDVLKVLDDRKLSDNTVVFFFGDHGWGMPRGKRWPYDSGTRVPLLVRWPKVIEPGSVRDDLVAFVDFAPTVLALAGAAAPPEMPGQVFLGPKRAADRKYAFSGRDRMDEAPDRVRSVRDARFRYVKNFHPELPYAQWLNYGDEMPTMKAWRRLAFEGKLDDVQKSFFARTKPAEELYDLQADPFETRNLAADPAHAATLAELRAALDKWTADTKDLGGVPEKELIEKGVVKDVLTTEYTARVKLHPKTPPVP